MLAPCLVSASKCQWFIHPFIHSSMSSLSPCSVPSLSSARSSQPMPPSLPATGSPAGILWTQHTPLSPPSPQPRESLTQVPTPLSSHGSPEQLSGEKREKMQTISAMRSSYQQNPGSTFQAFSHRRSQALSLAYVSCDTVLWSWLPQGLCRQVWDHSGQGKEPHTPPGPAEAADAAHSVLAAIVKSPQFQVSIFGAPTLCLAPTTNRQKRHNPCGGRGDEQMRGAVSPEGGLVKCFKNTEEGVEQRRRDLGGKG